MADENSPAPAENDDASKAETIRITLPPKQEQPVAKRETVRINLPGRPVPSSGVSPKKETTKIAVGGPTPPPPVAPPPAPGLPKVPSAPSAPAPPRPPGPPSAPGSAPAPPRPPGAPSAPSVPGIPAKPIAGVPPRAPGVGSQPTVPLKPLPGAGAAAPGAASKAAPKKETARITLPPEGSGKASLPKATMKMGQTQPLAPRPAPSAITTAPATMAPARTLVPVADDSLKTLGMVAAVLTIIAAGVLYTVYQAATAVVPQ